MDLAKRFFLQEEDDGENAQVHETYYERYQSDLGILQEKLE